MTAAKTNRRLPSILLAPDMPDFDEEVTGISHSDRFVCVPVVTFSDGEVVKTRRAAADNTQRTTSLYESYLEGMKRRVMASRSKLFVVRGHPQKVRHADSQHIWLGDVNSKRSPDHS
jgi:hypothetical protein